MGVFIQKLENRLPLILRIIGIFFVVGGILYYFYFYYNYNQYTGSTDFYNIFNVLGYNDNIYLFFYKLIINILLTIVVGIGLIIGKKWGLYLIIGYGILVILLNITYIIVYYLTITEQQVLNNKLLGQNESINNSFISIFFRSEYILKFLFGIVNGLLGIVLLVLLRRSELRAPFYKPEWHLRDIRYRCRIPVKYDLNNSNNYIESKTEDISEHGCFIITEDFPKIHNNIKVTFLCCEPNIELEGEVVWINKNINKYVKGFGVMYNDSNDIKAFNKLKNQIKKYRK